MSDLTCHVCHRFPAANARFHGHQGLLVLMRFSHADGPFCRDCGLATYRDLSSRTLTGGWWGPGSFFITLYVLVVNAARRTRFARLPASDRPRTAATLDPGKPLLDRPAAYGLLIPALLTVFVVWASLNGAA